MSITTIPRPVPPLKVRGPINPELPKIAKRAIAKRHICNLATVSDAGFPHVAAILYEAVGDVLYATAPASTRKVRNIAKNPKIAVSIPVRRVPVGPYSQVMFQGKVELLSKDDPTIQELLADGTLTPLTKCGELDVPDILFLRITPHKRINTFGLGMSIPRLAKDPLTTGDGYDLPIELGGAHI